jgi:hypothetical protein
LSLSQWTLTVQNARDGHPDSALGLQRTARSHTGAGCASVLAEMRCFRALGIGAIATAVCLCAGGQNAPGSKAQTEAKGLPPRVSPADYQAHAQAGSVTVAAEFKGHAVPTLQGTLSTPDYVAIETAVFGPPGARTTLAPDDFSLRINGKKTPLPSRPYGVVVETLTDPEWQPPESAAPKSRTRLSSGGEREAGEPGEKPTPVVIPFPVRRAMAQRVQKAALPEGDRPLPRAGLIFFEYHGKTENIRSLELIYAGPAGKATLTLQP